MIWSNYLWKLGLFQLPYLHLSLFLQVGNPGPAIMLCPTRYDEGRRVLVATGCRWLHWLLNRVWRGCTPQSIALVISHKRRCLPHFLGWWADTGAKKLEHPKKECFFLDNLTIHLENLPIFQEWTYAKVSLAQRKWAKFWDKNQYGVHGLPIIFRNNSHANASDCYLVTMIVPEYLESTRTHPTMLWNDTIPKNPKNSEGTATTTLPSKLSDCWQPCAPPFPTQGTLPDRLSTLGCSCMGWHLWLQNVTRDDHWEPSINMARRVFLWINITGIYHDIIGIEGILENWPYFTKRSHTLQIEGQLNSERTNSQHDSTN